MPVFFRPKPLAPKGPDDPAPFAAGLNRPASPTWSHASASEFSHRTFSSLLGNGAWPSPSEYDCALFSDLLRFIHREGDIGDAARTGILALIDVAASCESPSAVATSTTGPVSEDNRSLASRAGSTRAGELDLRLVFAEWILDSDLAEVVSAGIGALYGALPSKLVIRADSASAAAGLDETGFDGSTGGGMVLGGMGALQEEEDAEVAARRREAEDELLRSQGYGISGTPDFARALDAFLRFFEFAQGIVTRCSFDRAALTASQEETDAPHRQQRLVLGAIAATVIATLRSSFLQGILYPSILECSETDGSGVAVLTYLDALFGVLQDGTELESAVFAFLLAEDTHVSIVAQSPGTPSSRVRANARKGHGRKRSRGLILLDRPAPRPAATDDYFASTEGRFTLRDILRSNVASPNAATAAAALRLLEVVLTKHDRWSLALLDVRLDDLATAFPGVPFSASPPVAPSEVDLAPDEGTPEADEFVYPARDAPTTPRIRPGAKTFPSTPVSALRPLLDVGASRVASGSAAPKDPLEALLHLVGEIDPSYRRMRSAGGGSEMVTTGFSSYLRDAEAELAREPGFRRGLASLADLSVDETGVQDPAGGGSNRRRTRAYLSGEEYAAVGTGYRHRLPISSAMVSSLLATFARFFSHAPDTNLELSRVLATLALSPYRALDEWCLPSGDLSQPRRDSAARSDLFASPASRDKQSARTARSDSLFSILEALATSIEEYRRRIPRFDEYLAERRKGLFFADNLADALEGISLEPSLEAPAPLLSPAPRPLDPPTVPKPSVASGLAAFFSPRRQGHKRSPLTPNGPETPSRPGSGMQRPLSQLRRSTSDESLAPSTPTLPNGGPRNAQPPQARVSALAAEGRAAGGGAPASPFAAHYRETGSVQVRPVVVTTPSQLRRREVTVGENSSSAGDLDDDEAEQDAAETLTGTDSPLKRLSLATGPGSDRPASSTSSQREQLRGGEAPTVSLSTILDNVIVLEEFVKELAAVVYVRRALGVDPVRTVDA